MKKKDICNLLKKINFIIEFIASIFVAYSLYQIVVFKMTSNIWNFKYLTIFAITSIVVICNIIINLKENKEKFEKIVIGFLIPIGMLYVFFIAPSYVPDEQAHIMKAYDVSNGNIYTAIKEDGSSTIEIPKNLDKNMIPSIKKYTEFNEAINEKTDYNDTVEVDSSAKTYPFILYLPSAIGFFICRILNINCIVAIYFSRILNLILFLVASYYSIKIIPFGKKIIAVILFLPMFLQQAASVSVDSIINSISIFYIAFTLYMCKTKENINIKQKIIFLILSVIIGVSKIAYVPLAGLSILLFKRKDKKIILFIIATIIVTVLSGFLQYMFMQKYQSVEAHKIYTESNNVNTQEQLKEMVSNPKNAILAVIGTVNNGLYLDGTIGKWLGWLNIEVPNIVIYIFIILLTLSPFLEENTSKLNKLEKILFLMISIGTYLLVVVALYLTWTTVGAKVVSGVQGRYFIPILALPLLCICSEKKYIKFNNINIILPVLTSMLNIYTIMAVVKFFI